MKKIMKKKQPFRQIKKIWEKEIYPKMMDSQPFKEVFLNKINKELWGLLMVESGHLARFNPQLQAYCTMYFKGKDEEIVKSFLKHAISEIDHDKLAYKDASICGIPDTKGANSQPLSGTIALRALPLYLIQFESPISYLGYLFVLEFLPTSMGELLMGHILKNNIPKNATSFLKDHGSIDIHHNKLMEEYVELLVDSDEKLSILIKSMEYTSDLYIEMINGVLKKYNKTY